jgi:hypothetical protein
VLLLQSAHRLLKPATPTYSTIQSTQQLPRYFDCLFLLGSTVGLFGLLF